MTDGLRELIELTLVEDIQLDTDGTTLHYDAPAEVPAGGPDGYVERLRRLKPEVIRWLRAAPGSDGVLSRHPLSYYQLRQWTRHTQHPNPAVYNVRWDLELAGSVDEDALARAVSGLLARHEALRTRFVRRGDVVVAEVMAPPAEPPLVVVSPGDPRLDEACGPFDVAVSPLIRVALVRKDETNSALLLVLHHLACDNTTIGVLIDELTALYNGKSLPPAPVQFAGYARWQRRTLDDPAIRDRLLAHWRDELAGAELRPPLPYDRPRPAVRSGRGAEHRFDLGGDLVDRIDQVARRCGATRYTVLCAAFALLLGRITGRDDVVVVTSTTGRTQREHEATVGVFTDAMPLRVRLGEAATFTDLVSQIGRTLFAAIDHGPMPLVLLAEHVDGNRTPPLPTVLFTVLDGDPPVPHFDGVTATVVASEPGTVARTELYVTVQPYRDRLLGTVEYATDLFDAATIERWFAGWPADLVRQG